MDKIKTANNQKNRFLKLSLKKNKLKADKEQNKPNRSSDVIVIDESFEKLRSEIPKYIQSKPKVYSPIVIDDSCDSINDDLPKVVIPEKTPSKTGNVSFNCSKNETSATQESESRPSFGGWSPAQNILCATPRHEPMPTTPKDVANESLEQCSMKTIQSQKKLLSDLYGDKWKCIPSLVKSLTVQFSNHNGVSKKLHFDDDECDKENIHRDLKKNKELYLTGSDLKNKYATTFSDSEKKCKKKLYTEKVPSTPEVPKSKEPKRREVNSTTKKVKVNKAMSVTELVEIMRSDVDTLAKKVSVTPVEVKRLSFVGSLADNVPSWRCHPEALQYRDSYKTQKEQLTRRLYKEFNSSVFDNRLDEDMPIIWDTKLRSTAGTTTNRLVKTANGDRVRTSSIKLSCKVVDGPARLRDTLVHEMCHAATWLVDNTLRAGHGPLWKAWATRALRVYPELGEISRCHEMEIHFKYCYKCSKCGYSIKRHSKSIDVTKKCCGYCGGTFELILNKKTKDGAVISTPARKGGMNDFAVYVKENYANLKDNTKTHAQVMKLLGDQFSARKKKPTEL